MSQVHRAVLHQHPLGSMSLQDMGLLQDSLFLSGKSSLQDTGHKRGASGDCRMFHQGRFRSDLRASHEDLTCSVLYILTCKVAPQCFLADSNWDIYKGCGILIRWGSMSHLDSLLVYWLFLGNKHLQDKDAPKTNQQDNTFLPYKVFLGR